jgi:chemotaxis protein MotB
MARRRRLPQAPASHDRWLVSYADFITLLFAFFVVMYAASRVDRDKMMLVAASIEDAFAGQHTAVVQTVANAAPKSMQAAPEFRALVQAAVEQRMRKGMRPRDLEPLRRDLEKALEEEIKKGAITLRDGQDGLIISLSELGFFDSGSAEMRQTAEGSFQRIAQLLASRRCGVRVEGHTDDRPIRTSAFKSNWDLSTARATEIVKALIDRDHFEPALLSAAGYGEYHPVATNDTAAGRAQNRRVDLVVLSHEDAERLMPGPPPDSAVASSTAKQPDKRLTSGEQQQ